MGRETHEDVTFRGYNIPKGAGVVANIWRLHMDPEVYPNPDKFDVEHFLKSDGSLNNSNEDFMPFGIGSRMCLGEQLTKMELFLLVSNMLQRYKISFPQDYKPQDDSEIIDKMMRMCGPYTAIFTER